jgi:hypothetical protein
MKWLVLSVVVIVLSYGYAWAADTKAERIRILDTGGHYASIEVEGALQEIAGGALGSDSSLFESDSNGDAQPRETTDGQQFDTDVALDIQPKEPEVADPYYELDSNDDIMPRTL